ncbi:apolipoprotein N-acyltransferase [Aurantimonas sp. A2-1-M11]
MLLTLAAGAVCTLALPPYNFPAVGFIGFPLFVWLLDGAAQDPGRSLLGRMAPAFATGWLFGFGYFVAGLWWLGAAMMVDAASFAIFIPLAVLGLPAILAVYFGLAAALARFVWTDSAYRIFALAGSLALFEYLREILFTGFPWNEIGVMAAPLPVLMQTTSLIGIHGLTLFAVIVFASPAVLADRCGRGTVLVTAAALLVLHVGYGVWRLETHPTELVENVRVRVVQPNILQSLKWDGREAERIFDRHLSLTRSDAVAASTGDASAAASEPATAAGPVDGEIRTLIVWPESAFPFLLTERPDAIARIAEVLQPGETLIAGAARLEGTDITTSRVYNSVYVIDDAGQIVDARDKTHLVPFGEYLPFQDLLEGFGLSQLAEMPGGFSAGTNRSPVPLQDAPSFLPLICYEIIFPSEISAGAPDTRPGFFVNDTNDAWYGDTPGPYQHLRLAELTSVAFGLPLVRSANTGISVVTDAYGRQLDGLALGATGTIETALPRASNATIYARWGNTPFWIAFLAIWMVPIVARLRMRALID